VGVNYKCKNITCAVFNDELSNGCDIHNHCEGEDCKGRILHDQLVEALELINYIIENRTMVPDNYMYNNLADTLSGIAKEALEKWRGK
jgi:hypothetical protein